MTQSTLRISGIDQPITVTRTTIRSDFAESIIEDVSTLEEKRAGSGLRIGDLLRPPSVATATQLTLHSTDGFSATLPLEIAKHGILIFEHGGQPLPDSAGGPFRFFTIDSADCGTAVADNCANVKCIERIELA